MYSSNEGDGSAAAAAAAALSSRDSTYSMPPDHSTAVWERQPLSREKYDRDRYTPTKRDWSAESRSSSYRSPGLLAGGSLSASFNKRRAIGRHEPAENGRYRSAVGRTESSSSLLSPPQAGKAERDACSPGYGSSPNVERPSKSLDGHHHRDNRLSPGSARPLSSPRIDSRLHGNHNEPEASGAWDHEKSRFSSPYGWDVSIRGREYRERAWSRPDYRRPYPLPKLDSSKGWSQSDRELVEGRIDRYSGVSARETGFSDVTSGNNRETTRNDWKGRERALQSGIPCYSPTANPYNRDSKSFSLGPDALGSGSPPQYSFLQTSFSHDSDLDAGLISSKKRPRLTWGQGLAKYEKEKTGEDISLAKKSEEGSNFAGGLHSDGSVASALPELALQSTNTILCVEDGHQNQDQIGKLEVCVEGGIHQEQPQAVSRELITICSVETSDLSNLSELPHGNAMVLKNIGQSNAAGSVSFGTPDPCDLVLQYMQSFISKCKAEEPGLSKEVLTQHVERVELEIDRLEKELLTSEKELLMSEIETEEPIYPERNAMSTIRSSEEFFVSEPSTSGNRESPSCINSNFLMEIPSVAAEGKEEIDLVNPDRHVTYSLHDDDPCAKESNQSTADDYCSNGDDLPATFNDIAVPDVEVQVETSSSFETDPNHTVKDSAEFLLSSNQMVAKQSMSALAHLSGSRVGSAFCSEVLPRSIQDTIWWKQNSERHKEIIKVLQSRVSEERSLRSFTDGVLAIRYRAKREAWKQEQISNVISRDNAKLDDNLEIEQKGNVTPSQQSPGIVSSSSDLCVADASNEETQAVKKFVVDCPFDVARDYVKMPMMVTGQKERSLHRFESKNGLVEDPVAAELERKTINPWSPEERRIFLEKYSLLGKNLRKIASYLECKTVADCVQFFYQNQKSEEFEKIHRRHQLRKRREARSSALYLATATSVANSHPEANAAYVEGLSLVAAAAAAMSAPRSVRTLAIKSSLSGSAGSRACRDLNTVRQAIPSFAKDNYGDQLYVKYPEATSLRGFKRTSDDVLQWRSQWNNNERELFINAVALYGKDFDRISAYIGSKSVGQCKTYFSKARKRLGLDQLVERHRELPLDTRQQDDNVVNGVKAESHCELDTDSKMGDIISERLKSERSPIQTDSGLARDTHGDHFHKNIILEAVLGISSPKSSQAADYVGSSGLCQISGLPIVDTPMNNGLCASGIGTDVNAESSSISTKLRNAPLDGVQGCVNDSLVCVAPSPSKVEPRNLKLEAAMTFSSAVGASPSISSYGTPSPTLVSALTSPVGQSPQVKDRPVKTTEVKVRREPTSWTLEEKEKFVDILKVHGKNWDLLCKSLPAKSLVQIKTYFQNSKAKLGLGSDSTATNSGRGGASWKRKMDDSDSSNNAGPGLQTLPQKGHVISEEGNLKVSPSLLPATGGSGSNVLSAEALAYANIFGRKFMEDSLNAPKVFHAMSLGPSGSTPGIVPMLTSAVYPPPTLVSAQQPYLQTASSSMKVSQILSHPQLEQPIPSMMVVESNPTGMHQVHQLQPPQQVAVACQDLPITAVPPGCSKQPLQLEQLSLLQQAPPPSPQIQQVAEAVLQQLLPQAVQRHQQQLQLVGQQMPHHFQQVLSHHQAQSNWPSQSQVGSAAGPTPSQQMPQQTPLMQPHIHHTHGKLHALLQQHQQLPQLNQLQLLQLQRQQQQQQQHQQQQQQQQHQLLLHLQQAQALSQPHQIQNQAILVQQNHSFSTEQQQPALYRSFAQVSTAGEGFKQNDADFQSLTKSQQGAFGNVHQLLTCNQVNEALTPSSAVPESQLPASDVKLFGQSLLSQPVSGNQHLTAKFPSSVTSTGAAFTVPLSSFAGSKSGSAAPSTFRDSAIQGQGQGWQQGTLVGAHSNGNLRCVSAGEHESASLSLQDRVSCCSEKLKVEGPDNITGRGFDGKGDSPICRLSEGHPSSNAPANLDKGAISSRPSFSCGSSNASLNQIDTQRSGNLDHLIAQSMSRKEDSLLVAGSTGGDVTVSQGLPRVLDALVALAEWRLQNSSGCGGKLTDEFLSQSWEALQKNPGSLIEAGRAGGSLSQIYQEGPQMLQHLRERLLSSHNGGSVHSQSSAGSTGVPGIENVGPSNNGLRVSLQVPVTPINEGDLTRPDEFVTTQIDADR